MAEQRVVAVIPLYRPPADIADRVSELLGQVAGVVLVDDGTENANPLDLDLPGVDLLANPENRGIAHALNTAIARARELGATHVLTLDQDSAVTKEFVDRLLSALEREEARGLRVAAAVPEMVGGAPQLREPDGTAFEPIQAGQLLPMSVVDAVGAFDERLFIDAVDSDFVLRARELGFRFVIAEGVTLGHALGESVPVTLFGRPLVIRGRSRSVIYHKPFRTYYMVRNSVHLARTRGATSRRWMWRRVRKTLEMIVGCSLLAPDRAQQLRAIRLGIRDGRRGQPGKIPDDVLRRLQAEALA